MIVFKDPYFKAQTEIRVMIVLDPRKSSASMRNHWFHNDIIENKRLNLIQKRTDHLKQHKR